MQERICMLIYCRALWKVLSGGYACRGCGLCCATTTLLALSLLDPDIARTVRLALMVSRGATFGRQWTSRSTNKTKSGRDRYRLTVEVVGVTVEQPVRGVRGHRGGSRALTRRQTLGNFSAGNSLPYLLYYRFSDQHNTLFLPTRLEHLSQANSSYKSYLLSPLSLFYTTKFGPRDPSFARKGPHATPFVYKISQVGSSTIIPFSKAAFKHVHQSFHCSHRPRCSELSITLGRGCREALVYRAQKPKDT